MLRTPAPRPYRNSAQSVCKNIYAFARWRSRRDARVLRSWLTPEECRQVAQAFAEELGVVLRAATKCRG